MLLLLLLRLCTPALIPQCEAHASHLLVVGLGNGPAIHPSTHAWLWAVGPADGWQNSNRRPLRLLLTSLPPRVLVCTA